MRTLCRVRGVVVAAAAIAVAVLVCGLDQARAEVPTNYRMPAPVPPDQAVKTFKVYPGFAIELMVAEPMVTDPVNFCWTADGKLFVVEMGDYPEGVDGKGAKGGVVRCIEDTNGDGKYDKSAVFLDKLGFPNGVYPYRDGVLVTSPPDILFARDTNGDGVADTREVLYTGFKEGNPQHRANGFVYGLDNWFYGAAGDSPDPIKSLKTGKVVDIRGRDFRINPTTGDVEAVSGNSQFPRTRDEWGNWFSCENSAPSMQFMLEDRYLKRNPHVAPPAVRRHVAEVPGAAPIYPISEALERFNDYHTLNRFTSACGLTFYRDELFGSGYRGNSFVSEPVHNLIHREIVWQDGVYAKSRRADDEHRMEFIASTDNWFRPTSLKVGPDGALWIADMYRLVIEHPKWIPKEWQERLNLRAGDDMGRIYRVYPPAKPKREVPNLAKLDTAGLVSALDAPGSWQRDLVQQMLVERQDKSAVAPLEKLAATAQRPVSRLHALCTLDGLDAASPAVLLKALEDPMPGIRAHAVRIAETRLKSAPKELGDAVLAKAKDPDPMVRMQLAYTLGEWDDARVGPALAAIALRDGKDPYLAAAVMSSVNEKNLPPVVSGVTTDAKKPAPPGVLANLLRVAAATKNDAALAAAIGGMVGGGEADPKAAAPAAQFAALGAALDGLDQNKLSLSALKERGGVLAGAVDNLAGVLDAARETAIDDAAEPKLRASAARLLGRGLTEDRQTDVELLAGLLTPQTPEAVQSAAISALGRISGPEAVKASLAAWAGLTPALRQTALDSMLSRQDRLPLLLDAIDAKKVPASDLDANRRRQVLEHANESIRARATKTFAGVVNADRQKVIDQFGSSLTLQGDAGRGKEFFTTLCSTCHRVADVGVNVGPNLLALSDQSPEYYLVHVLDPNRAVEGRFVNYMVETKTGESFAGVLTGETGSSVTLTGPGGKAQTVLRSDVKRLRGTTLSAMPEGLEAGRTPQDFADLFAFLTTGRPPQPRKTVAGNNPAAVKPAGDTGVLRLLPSTAEIYGASLTLEPEMSNLGWWNSADDRAAWSVDTPGGGRYDVVLEFACDNAAAGNAFVLTAGKEKLTGKVPATGGWTRYRKETIGRIELPAGAQRVELRPSGKVNVALIDLRAIELVPAKD